MKKTGSALILIIIFTAVAMLVISTAVAIISNNLSSKTAFNISDKSYISAESGVENALMLLLRKRDYIGESFNFNQGNVNVTVSGSPIITITSTSNINNYNRTIVVIGEFNGNKFEISSWGEQ